MTTWNALAKRFILCSFPQLIYDVLCLVICFFFPHDHRCHYHHIIINHQFWRFLLHVPLSLISLNRLFLAHLIIFFSFIRYCFYGFHVWLFLSALSEYAKHQIMKNALKTCIFFTPLTAFHFTNFFFFFCRYKFSHSVLEMSSMVPNINFHPSHRIPSLIHHVEYQVSSITSNTKFHPSHRIKTSIRHIEYKLPSVTSNTNFHPSCRIPTFICNVE